MPIIFTVCRCSRIWAHRSGQEYFGSDAAALLLTQRRETLFPWVDENSRLVAASKWLDGDIDFKMGGMHFELRHVGPAHAPDDMVMFVKEDKTLFTGDLIFIGRVPYVGDADSRSWLVAIDKLIAFKPKFLITGHGIIHPGARSQVNQRLPELFAQGHGGRRG